MPPHVLGVDPRLHYVNRVSFYSFLSGGLYQNIIIYRLIRATMNLYSFDS